MVPVEPKVSESMVMPLPIEPIELNVKRLTRQPVQLILDVPVALSNNTLFKFGAGVLDRLNAPFAAENFIREVPPFMV